MKTLKRVLAAIFLLIAIVFQKIGHINHKICEKILAKDKEYQRSKE